MYEQNHSTTIGCTLILSGTAIGAGMLALPLVLSSIGFILGIFLFLITAFFAVISALYAFEANIAIRPGCNLYMMASETLGRIGRILSIIAPLGLFYALMSAYFSGGGILLATNIKSFYPEASSSFCVIIFALISAIFVYYSTKAVDLVNRFFFCLMIIAFILVVVSLSSELEYENIVYTPKIEYLSIFAALPVIFTSFGYHGSIPSIIIYQQKHLKHIPMVFLLSTLLPLMVYVLWLLVVMGGLSEAQLLTISRSSGNTTDLIAVLTQNSYVYSFVQLFSNLALLTSVLGVSLGLFDYIANLLHRSDSLVHRFQTALVTFIPPVVISILFPTCFVIALGYAAVALAIIAILLPTAMVYILRKKVAYRNTYKVPGGIILLTASFLFGCFIILSHFISD